MNFLNNYQNIEGSFNQVSGARLYPSHRMLKAQHQLFSHVGDHAGAQSQPEN